MGTEEVTVNIPPLVWCEQMDVCVATQQVKTRPDMAPLKLKFGLFFDMEFPETKHLKAEQLGKIKMLACTLLANTQVAFRKRESGTNFLDYCKEQLHMEVNESEMTVNTRKKKKLWVCSLPLGLPFERYQKLLKIYLPLIEIPPFETSFILRVDSVTEGCSVKIRRRFQEFCNLLTYEPTIRGWVILVQILLVEGDPNQSFSEGILHEKSKIESFATDLNSVYNTSKWKPIVIFYGLPSQPELETFYDDTSFMQSFGIDNNLSEKEFLLMKTDTNPSRLVFVPYFGCSNQLREAHLMKSELPQLNEKLMRTMFLSEESKLEGLLKVRTEPVDFLEEYLMRALLILADSVVTVELIGTTPVSDSVFHKKLSHILRYSHLTLTLDVDGTLLDRPKGTNHHVTIDPELRAVIKRLADSSKIDIVIIGADNTDGLYEKVNVDGVAYIGNFGGKIVYKNGNVYEELVNKNNMSRRFDLASELHNKACKFGAYMTDRGGTLIFNSSEAPPIFSRDLVTVAREIAVANGFPAYKWRSGLMIQLIPAIEKGKGLLKYLNEVKGAIWMHSTYIVYVGDEFTDELAIKKIKTVAEATLVRVTKGYFPKTQAAVKLTDSRGVLALLLWLEKNYLAVEQ